MVFIEIDMHWVIIILLRFSVNSLYHLHYYLLGDLAKYDMQGHVRLISLILVVLS